METSPTRPTDEFSSEQPSTPHPSAETEVSEVKVNEQAGPRETEAPVAPARQSRRLLWAGLAVGAALLGSFGAWYGLGGYWKDSTPTLTAFKSAMKDQDRTALRTLLDTSTAQGLSREQLDMLMGNLPNYSDPALSTTIEKPEGLQHYFARQNIVRSSYDRKSGSQAGELFTPLTLTLERGEWRFDGTELIKVAFQLNGLALEQAAKKVTELDNLSRTEIARRKDAAERDYKELLAFASQAQDADERFNPSDKLVNAKARLGKIQERLAWFSKINDTEDLFSKARALTEGGDVAGAMATYQTILRTIEATAAQKEQARDLLSIVGAADVELKVGEARRLYGRADYQKAISVLQEVVDNDDASEFVKAEALSLMGFAFRDYSDAPNNLQRAIGAAREAKDLEPTNSYYWCNLGDLLRQYRNYDAANDAFNRGIELALTPSGKAECYVWQGVNHMDTGDYSIARYLWETALSLDPQNPDARRFLGDDE